MTDITTLPPQAVPDQLGGANNLTTAQADAATLQKPTAAKASRSKNTGTATRRIAMSTKAPTADAATPITSKADVACSLLREPAGAALDQITAATGWQPHSARAFHSGLKKKGSVIERTKVDGVSRYRITTESVQ